MVQSILFKLAVDKNGLYNGMANANKAAGHELKGLINFFINSSDLVIRVPLVGTFHHPFNSFEMALIDYRGFRVNIRYLFYFVTIRNIDFSDVCNLSLTYHQRYSSIWNIRCRDDDPG